MNLTRVVTLLLLLGCLTFTAYSYPASNPVPSPSPAPSASPNPQRSESFWGWVFRVTGISATPRNQRDDYKVKPGHIWVANLQVRLRVPTEDGGYISPVFFNDGENLLALQGNNLVKVSVETGAKQVVKELKGALKLIGFAGDDPDKVLLLKDEDQDSCPSVAILALNDGTMTSVPFTKQGNDQDLLTHLETWTRTYDGGEWELKTRKEGSDWFNVFLKQKNKDPVNISKCDQVNCSQGSLSKDRKRVVFIKEQ
jgi:hypothetical protein